jgi:transcription elongation factor Elf1
MKEKAYPFSCPICAKETDYPLEIFVEGAVLTCPFCKLSLRLHGHMLAYIQKEIQELEKIPDE